MNFFHRELIGLHAVIEFNDLHQIDGALWAVRDFIGRFRLLSAYTLSNGTKIWIITEADRSATTLLLPSEY